MPAKETDENGDDRMVMKDIPVLKPSDLAACILTS